VLDVVECDMAYEEEQEVVDWVASFPPEQTNLESLSFEWYIYPVCFSALEALVVRSPHLKRLGVNQHVTLGQLRRLMSRAPRLSHLGTGAFRPADGGEEGVDFGHMVTAFADSGRGRTLLSLSGFRDLAQEYLPTIAVVCGNLRSLDLSYAPVTPNQIVMFIGQCFNLETLWVLSGLLCYLGFTFALCLCLLAADKFFLRSSTLCAMKGWRPWHCAVRSSSLFASSH
jgi:hypothetical protein